MTDKVSVRLGELAGAVDKEAKKDRRSRSDMIRMLIEDALAYRREGVPKLVHQIAAVVGDGCSVEVAGWVVRVDRVISQSEPKPLGGSGCVCPLGMIDHFVGCPAHSEYESA